MSQLDTYRNAMIRKREDLAKLNQDLAKEQAKVSPLQKKIISAKSAIARTKNQTTINTKYKEIERANKSISDIQKKCGYHEHTCRWLHCFFLLASNTL